MSDLSKAGSYVINNDDLTSEQREWYKGISPLPSNAPLDFMSQDEANLRIAEGKGPIPHRLEHELKIADDEETGDRSNRLRRLCKDSRVIYRAPKTRLKGISKKKSGKSAKHFESRQTNYLGKLFTLLATFHEFDEKIRRETEAEDTITEDALLSMAVNISGMAVSTVELALQSRIDSSMASFRRSGPWMKFPLVGSKGKEILNTKSLALELMLRVCELKWVSSERSDRIFTDIEGGSINTAGALYTELFQAFKDKINENVGKGRVGSALSVVEKLRNFNRYWMDIFRPLITNCIIKLNQRGAR